MTPPDDWILPEGTHVVLRRAVGDDHPAGVTATVARSPETPDGGYRIRFADGSEATLGREALALQKAARRPGLDPPEPEELLPWVVLEAVVGSRLHGLAVEGSDTDVTGVVLPPAAMHWSLAGVPEQFQLGEAEYWELERFLQLALRANPNVLEVLWSDQVRRLEPAGAALVELRDAFLSRVLHASYSGYALSQHRKLVAAREQGREPDWKHAMHLLRLLRMACIALETGDLPVHAGEARERLLAVRRGEVPWAEVEAWRTDLHARLDAALEATDLPERPDVARVDAFLVDARRSRV